MQFARSQVRVNQGFRRPAPARALAEGGFEELARPRAVAGPVPGPASTARIRHALELVAAGIMMAGFLVLAVLA